MTSPRSTYGGGYYSAPSFPDTPIYDSLVAERGTPQIAPIRVPAAYDSASSGYSSGGYPSGGYSSGGYLPALPSALPALPAAPSAPAPQQGGPAYGYPYQQQAPQPAPLQHAPAPYIPQQQPRPVAAGTGYEAMRPAAPRPMTAAPVPSVMTSTAPTGIPTGIPAYQDQYARQYPGRGY
ncbi:DUF6643 family protein [Streptomyces bambusae]|uniref:Uncharacterized protein n=1 Tax=Streptomyces bambusae TaxID=1550616 RepID=A0ABS6ZGB4_9ACTN|nr:DUF6643 family protein [Streptomyces bambusae]MBW5486802.1 hypothetical protein [Streptomyces bambusae]